MLTTTKPTQKRSKPYAWVTWLAKLMAESKKCNYPEWLRTQYQVPTIPSDYDSSAHDQMVRDRATVLEKRDFTVHVETTNTFKVQGQTHHICVAGRPDLLAVKNDWSVVEDCKSGKPHLWHQYQVRLYMLLLPLASETNAICGKHIPHGRLIYPNNVIEIPAWSVDKAFKEKLRQTIAMITHSQPPNHQPNAWECRYCSLTPTYCQAKQDFLTTANS
jgi:CRISPR/Cas system-associated exonuclease Cas4 (RecB family)